MSIQPVLLVIAIASLLVGIGLFVGSACPSGNSICR